MLKFLKRNVFYYLSHSFEKLKVIMPSRVWNYFTRSSDKAKATCDLCKKVFDYKGTRNSLASDF